MDFSYEERNKKNWSKAEQDELAYELFVIRWEEEGALIQKEMEFEDSLDAYFHEQKEEWDGRAPWGMDPDDLEEEGY